MPPSSSTELSFDFDFAFAFACVGGRALSAASALSDASGSSSSSAAPDEDVVVVAPLLSSSCCSDTTHAPVCYIVSFVEISNAGEVRETGHRQQNTTQQTTTRAKSLSDRQRDTHQRDRQTAPCRMPIATAPQSIDGQMPFPDDTVWKRKQSIIVRFELTRKHQHESSCVRSSKRVQQHTLSQIDERTCGRGRSESDQTSERAV
jgi:hypothetical protein